jgi:hypothetical protein
VSSSFGRELTSLFPALLKSQPQNLMSGLVAIAGGLDNPQSGKLGVKLNVKLDVALFDLIGTSIQTQNR